MKYFLGFARTQLSTTVTIFVIFGPKVTTNLKKSHNEPACNEFCPQFVRVVRGTGDEWEDRNARAVRDRRLQQAGQDQAEPRPNGPGGTLAIYDRGANAATTELHPFSAGGREVR